jgi:uncharacterized membrane protein
MRELNRRRQRTLLTGVLIWVAFILTLLAVEYQCQHVLEQANNLLVPVDIGTVDLYIENTQKIINTIQIINVTLAGIGLLIYLRFMYWVTYKVF